VVNFTANQVGKIPDGSVQRVATGVVYFTGLTQIVDPAVANLPNATLRQVSGLKAIADSNGNPLLVNPLPGQMGTLGWPRFEGRARRT